MLHIYIYDISRLRVKVVRLSALRTGRLYLLGNIPGTHFCYRLSRPRGHIVAGRIMSMKNPNDTIGNRNRDLPVCSAVLQPTAPPRAPVTCQVMENIISGRVSTGYWGNGVTEY